jgi:predicted dehydrogenase
MLLRGAEDIAMSQIRWGIIGCGDVVRKRVAQAIIDEPRSELIAACRRNEAALRDFCESFSVERAYASADDLIADPDIDAIYIATPVRDHMPQTVAAARAGKHVLVEKPMAMSVAECEMMIAACREAGVNLGVAYYRRFYPLVQRMRELIGDGSLGTPLAVSAITATQMDMRPGEDGYWRAIPEDGGGGALMDVGSHRINVFLHLFGEIAEVKAICKTVVADYRAEDTALLVMNFHSGATGTLQCHFGCADPDEFAITGTAGRLVARPLNGDELIVQIGDERRVERHPPADNLCGPLVADFASAIAEDRAPRVTGEEGRATNEVMQWAYADAQVNDDVPVTAIPVDEPVVAAEVVTDERGRELRAEPCPWCCEVVVAIDDRCPLCNRPV